MFERIGNQMQGVEATIDKLVQRQDAQHKQHMTELKNQEMNIGQRVDTIVSNSLSSHIQDSLRGYMPTFEADAYAALERATLHATEGVCRKIQKEETDIITR